MDDTGSHLVSMCRDDGWLHMTGHSKMGGNSLTSIAHYNCKLCMLLIDVYAVDSFLDAPCGQGEERSLKSL